MRTCTMNMGFENFYVWCHLREMVYGGKLRILKQEHQLNIHMQTLMNGNPLFNINIKKKKPRDSKYFFSTSKINQGLIWIRTCRVLCLPSIFAAFNEHCSRKLDLYSTVERAVSDSLNWARCVTRKMKPLSEKQKYRVFALGLSCSILHECTIKTITKNNLIVVARLSFMWDFDFMFNFCNDSSPNG